MTKKKNETVTSLEEKNGNLMISTLTKISEAITSDLYLEDILRLIVTLTAETLNSTICSLMLLNSERTELIVKATQSISEAYNKKPNIPIGKGIAGSVAQTGSAITSLDVRIDERYISKDIARKENLCSLLSVPLILKGTIIGVLNCYTDTKHEFHQDEIDMVRSIANQAVIVIENFRLVVETQVIKEELESRKVVEKAKRILMQHDAISEDEAYKKLRKHSMDKRRSIREIAEAIILTEEVRSAEA